MKTHKYKKTRTYSKGIWRFASGSFVQSLATALIVGTMAALLGIIASAALYRRNVTWYISAGAGPLVDTVVVIVLATIALEGARRRSIRRTLELSFLNHHVRNALTQVMMASHVPDPAQQDRFIQEAVSRISEALFRVTNSPDHSGISLQADLRGEGMIHEGTQRRRNMGAGNENSTSTQEES